MKFLFQGKRAGIVVLASALLGAAALTMGAGTAGAHTFPCSETDNQDIYVNAAGTYAGVDPGGGNIGWVWVCAAPTGGASNQSWVVVTTHDPSSGGPGGVVQVGGCTGVVPGDPFPYGCTYLVEPTGVDPNLTPTVDPPTPVDGNNVVGGGIDGNPCVYANDTSPACPFGGRVVGVFVAENDVQPVPGKVAIDPNASSQPLVTVTVGPTNLPVDFPIPTHCIGIC